jgi:uncharacterized protein (DUF58 family)
MPAKQAAPATLTLTAPAGMGWLRRLVWQRWQQFLRKRLTPSDQTQLTQRNLFILPTPAGLSLALGWLVLLVGSINYQLNLGYLLCFLVAGTLAAGVYVGHSTLRGLTLRLLAHDAVFANQHAQLGIELVNPQRSARYGIGLVLAGGSDWQWSSVPPQGRTEQVLSFLAPQRGVHALPPVTVQTRFPLGTFRVWSVWRLASGIMVYPAAELQPPPLPLTPSDSESLPVQAASTPEEWDGLRNYRTGDPLKTIAWKKTAQTDHLVSHAMAHMQAAEIWLDLAQTQGLVGYENALERQLSRLCAWVLQAQRQGLHYGLRLGGVVLAPANGPHHQQACLEALAKYPAA